MGIGPLYVFIILLITFACLVLNFYEKLPIFYISEINFILKLCSVFFAGFGIFLWVNAVILNKISKNITENKLVTTGAYRLVRNPIYTAFMFLCWGMLLWTCNLFLLIPIPFYWLIMTLLLKNSEEKWLKELYGKEYTDYCKKVNRCIPWFCKK